jgi:hypothetical protein
MPGASFAAGDPLQVRLPLGDDLVVAGGEVIFVRTQPELEALDVVVDYELREPVAALVRRYLYTWEIDQRRRASDN